MPRAVAPCKPDVADAAKHLPPRCNLRGVPTSDLSRAHQRRLGCPPGKATRRRLVHRRGFARPPAKAAIAFTAGRGPTVTEAAAAAAK
eukprot:9841-Chlamydomonas_euryale.AAC.1